MDFDQDHQDTLDNTNKLLHDLERKLSFVSSTSNQTHNSNQSGQSNSSIVVNKNLAGLGKQNIKSTVLLYIKANENEFSTNDIYEERLQKFMTKFGKNYNTMPSQASPATSTESDVIALESPIKELLSDQDEVTYSQDSEEYEDIEQPEDDDSNQNLHGIFYNDYDYEDDSDDMLYPPSPPRSPPREIDPDKLYGLYDFSGPDPLHCSLLRDEPVYLINDLDNYWWLIKKLTKQERIKMNRDRNLKYGIDNNPHYEDELTDAEDGKIGFVPAECLETYGERLARLNCFKNEELERNSRDNLESPIIDEYANDFLDMRISLSNIINYQNDSQESFSRTGSLKRKSAKSKSTGSINKSVTFEDVKDLELDENDETYSLDGIPLRNHHEDDAIHSHYFDIPREEIEKIKPPVLDINNNSETSHNQEKTSEVLSEDFSKETPLVVVKNNRKKNEGTIDEPIRVSSGPEVVDLVASPESLLNKTPDLQAEYRKPPTPYPRHKNPYDFEEPPTKNDDASIGFFSPDTPKDTASVEPPNSVSTLASITPPSKGEDPTQFRRSLILDRLNKVTFDIQEQLNLHAPDLEDGVTLQYYSPDNLTFGAQLKPEDDEGVDDLDVYDDDDQAVQAKGSSPVNNSDSESVTPLTSMNSLSNGISSMSSITGSASKPYYNPIHATIPENSQITNEVFNYPKTSISEHRKSKPVHDMFLPILGKFDSLADKLAELEDLL